MNIKTILSWIALLAGEAILIAAFFLWRGDAQNGTFVLNIAVATVVYCLAFADLLLPWTRPGDKSRRIFGSLGIRWFATGLYSVLAVAVMVLGGPVFRWAFATQLILQGVLLLGLLLAGIGAMYASDRVTSVHAAESAGRTGIERMKKAVASAADTAVSRGLPAAVTERLTELQGNLRYLSPSDNPEAAELEGQFVSAVRRLESAMADAGLNVDRMEADLISAENLYRRRKSLYH